MIVFAVPEMTEKAIAALLCAWLLLVFVVVVPIVLTMAFFYWCLLPAPYRTFDEIGKACDRKRPS